MREELAATAASLGELDRELFDSLTPELHRQKELQDRLYDTKKELEQLTLLMESERRILPLPKRRVTSGSTLPAPSEVPPSGVPPNVLFSQLQTTDNEVNLASAGANTTQFSPDFSDLNGAQLESQHGDHADLGESEEDEDDDECTGCRDWLENVKNKKKRKIPTSAVMGHTNSVSSPVQHVYGTTISPSRGSKTKTRRRRTWDVSSEARPDTSLRAGRDGNSSAMFPVRIMLYSTLR